MENKIVSSNKALEEITVDLRMNSKLIYKELIRRFFSSKTIGICKKIYNKSL